MIQLKTRDFWKTTIALSLGSLLIFANIYFTQPLLPIFTKEFNISPLQSSLSVSLVIFALGISLFFYGPLSDSIGRRGIMIITMGLATITTFGISFVDSYSALLVLRVIQGILLAGLPSIAVAYIGEEFAPKALGLAIGIYISGNTIGGMFGRVFSGVLTDYYNWKTAFFAMGIVSFLLFITFIVLLRPSEYFEPKQFKWKDAMANYKGHLKNIELRYAYLIGGLHFFIFVGHFNYVTYLLSNSPYYLSSTLLGMLFLTYLAGTISSPIAGKVSSRIPKTVCIGIGICIMFIGFLITLIPSLIAIIGGILLNCFGFFFSHSVASSWVSERGKNSKASASGLYLISYYIGGSLGAFYLDPFWRIWSWNGVVIGCLVILILTSIITKKLYNIEIGLIKDSMNGWMKRYGKNKYFSNTR
jgi:YNFM family putative membrane transporter